MGPIKVYYKFNSSRDKEANALTIHMKSSSVNFTKRALSVAAIAIIGLLVNFHPEWDMCMVRLINGDIVH